MACSHGLLALLMQLALLKLVGGCDAGVFWGENCTTDRGTGNPSPACDGYPSGANATSTSTILIWEKGGKGSGGQDDLGGDVFLSTVLNVGCGSTGYYGSQMHFNSTFMNLDWAIWDIGGDEKSRKGPCTGRKNCVSAQPLPFSAVRLRMKLLQCNRPHVAIAANHTQHPSDLPPGAPEAVWAVRWRGLRHVLWDRALGRRQLFLGTWRRVHAEH